MKENKKIEIVENQTPYIKIGDFKITSENYKGLISYGTRSGYTVLNMELDCFLDYIHSLIEHDTYKTLKKSNKIYKEKEKKLKILKNFVLNK